MDRNRENDDIINMVNRHHEANRKTGNIVELTDYANTKDTRTMINRAKENDKQRNTKKRNIKNKPSNKKLLGKLAVAMASVALFAAFVEAARNNENKPEQEMPTTEYAEAYKEETTQDVIDTITEVEEDFVNDYLEAYNAKYGTTYSAAELLVTNLAGTSIYELDDGRKVTRGSLPYETQKVLSQIGEYKSVEMYSDVIQVLLPSGKALGTYNVSTGEFIYSGNQLSDLTNEDFEEPTLEELGIDSNKLNAAARVLLARGVEDGQSIDIRIDKYNIIDEEER